MANTYVKSNFHIIFRVKKSFGNIRNEDLPRLHSYIGGVIKGLGGVAWIVGGVSDHVHILASVPPTICLADFLREVKSKSSKWIKTIQPCYAHFSWQSGYGAFTVSASVMDATRAYIANQERHHLKKTYKNEFISFLEANNVDYIESYLED